MSRKAYPVLEQDYLEKWNQELFIPNLKEEKYMEKERIQEETAGWILKFKELYYLRRFKQMHQTEDCAHRTDG